MDKAGSSIVAPGAGAPGLKAPGSAPAGAPAVTGGAAAGSSSGGAKDWKLKIALILLIGVFVFAAAYKLNKTKRAKKGGAVAVSGAGSSSGGGSSGPSVCSVGGECKKDGPGPIPLPGFSGAPSKDDK